MTKTLLACAAIAALGAPAFAFAQSTAQATRMAHDAYLSAINSNSLPMFLSTVTDDIVFIAPDAPVLEGKAEVGPWVAGYFGAVRTVWEKNPVELVVSGDWAFERYSYTSIDVPHGQSVGYAASGSGLNIYRLENDGVWRVARDVWATSGAVRTVELGCGWSRTMAAPC